MKAFVVNRFGDFGFLAGLLLLFWALGGAWTPRDGVAAQRPTTVPRPSCNASAGAANAAAGRRARAAHRRGEGRPDAELPRAARPGGHRGAPGVKERLLGTTIWGVSLLALIGDPPLRRRDGQERAAPALRLAPRRDGRPDAGLRPHPRGDDGHRRRLHGGAAQLPLRAVARRRWAGSRSSARSTALFAASIGFFQYDIKKVLAYSTVSQLGFMFIGVGVGAYWAGVYHLLTHAFFKATPLPRVRLRHPRLPPRAGHAEDGRPQEVHAHHAVDLPLRLHRHRRLPDRERLLLEGRDPLEGVHEPPPRALRAPDAVARPGHLPRRHRRGDRHRLLHVPLVLHDLHRRVPRRRGSPRRAQRGSARGRRGEGVGALARGPRRRRRRPRVRPTATRPRTAPSRHAAATRRRARARRGTRRTGTTRPRGRHDDAGDGHGHHGGTPHESPWTITLVLSLLAARLVPHAVPRPPDAAWTPRAAARALARAGAPRRGAAVATRTHTLGVRCSRASASRRRSSAGSPPAPSTRTRRATSRRALKARFEGVWTVVYNKYYVDELYARRRPQALGRASPGRSAASTAPSSTAR